MTQKDPYIPILVGLGPKLWSVTLKLCQRAKLSVPLFIFGIVTLTLSCLILPILNSCSSCLPPAIPRPLSASRRCCSQTMLRLDPKAVQWKNSCRVSLGKRNGEP